MKSDTSSGDTSTPIPTQDNVIEVDEPVDEPLIEDPEPESLVEDPEPVDIDDIEEEYELVDDDTHTRDDEYVPDDVIIDNPTVDDEGNVVIEDNTVIKDGGDVYVNKDALNQSSVFSLDNNMIKYGGIALAGLFVVMMMSGGSDE